MNQKMSNMSREFKKIKEDANLFNKTATNIVLDKDTFKIDIGLSLTDEQASRKIAERD